MTAAFELLAGYRAFPHGTVFIVVVDPGVGTERRAIAARAGEYLFVGPDNGVFDLVFDELPPSLVVELTDARYALAVISRTFEGRDRFAPAGAWLASGVPQTDLGAAGRRCNGASIFRDRPSPPAAPTARWCMSIASAIWSPTSTGARGPARSSIGSMSRSADIERFAWSRPTPRRRRVRSSRCLAAPTGWRLPSGRGMRPKRWASDAARPCTSPGVRDTMRRLPSGRGRRTATSPAGPVGTRVHSRLE